MEQALAARKAYTTYGIHFDFDKASIRNDSVPLLKQIATALRNNPLWTLSIAGHTDSIGDNAYNMKLSQGRANSVKATLVRLGVSSDRLTTSGAGPSEPIATNKTLQGRALDRRTPSPRVSAFYVMPRFRSAADCDHPPPTGPDFRADDHGERREALLTLSRQAKERGWWQSYSGAVPSAYANFIGLEAEAATIRAYEPELFPGLLQTADYARAVIRAGRPADTAEEIGRRVEVRLERQEVLTRTVPPPPKVSVVLNEGVLARRVGGPEVMRAQIEHLMRERDRANIVIQILPFSSGEHPAMVGPFTMLTFLDPADPGVVNVENVMGSLALEKPEEIRSYEEVWGAIQAKAVSPGDSRAVMRTYSLR